MTFKSVSRNCIPLVNEDSHLIVDFLVEQCYNIFGIFGKTYGKKTYPPPTTISRSIS
jgi:hypothetical protein